VSVANFGRNSATCGVEEGRKDYYAASPLLQASRCPGKEPLPNLLQPERAAALVVEPQALEAAILSSILTCSRPVAGSSVNPSCGTSGAVSHSEKRKRCASSPRITALSSLPERSKSEGKDDS
jgi:hypothetical protein